MALAHCTLLLIRCSPPVPPALPILPFLTSPCKIFHAKGLIVPWHLVCYSVLRVLGETAKAAKEMFYLFAGIAIWVFISFK